MTIIQWLKLNVQDKPQETRQGYQKVGEAYRYEQALIMRYCAYAHIYPSGMKALQHGRTGIMPAHSHHNKIPRTYSVHKSMRFVKGKPLRASVAKPLLIRKHTFVYQQWLYNE